MASTRPGGRARRILVLFLVMFFVVDVGLLVHVVQKERRLAADTPPATQHEQPAPPAPDNAGGDAETLRAAHEALQKQYDALRTDADELRGTVKQLNDEAAALKQTVQTRFADHETLRSEVARIDGRLAETQEALTAASNDLDAANQRITTLETKLKGAADLVARLNGDLKAARDDTAAHKGRADTLQKSLDEANTSLEATEKALDEKTKAVNALNARVEELEKQLGNSEGPGSPGEGSRP